MHRMCPFLPLWLQLAITSDYDIHRVDMGGANTCGHGNGTLVKAGKSGNVRVGQLRTNWVEMIRHSLFRTTSLRMAVISMSGISHICVLMKTSWQFATRALGLVGTTVQMPGSSNGGTGAVRERQLRVVWVKIRTLHLFVSLKRWTMSVVSRSSSMCTAGRNGTSYHPGWNMSFTAVGFIAHTILPSSSISCLITTSNFICVRKSGRNQWSGVTKSKCLPSLLCIASGSTLLQYLGDVICSVQGHSVVLLLQYTYSIRICFCVRHRMYP